MFGHTHLYERTYPILDNNINYQNGVVYVNSGGAGGGLEDFDPVRNWFTKELRVTHHLCTFQVFEDKIEFKAIDHNGHVFDSYFFTKENKTLALLNPPAPKINVDKLVFKDNTNVSFQTLNNNYKVRYTIDGSEPTATSSLFTSPININTSLKIRAAAFDDKGHRSRMVEKSLKKMMPKPGVKVDHVKPGLNYDYYEGNFNQLPDFKSINPINSGETKLVSLNTITHREDQFAVVYEGYVDIAEENTYEFYLYSDDGSRMFIDDELLIDADGKHSLTYFSGTTILDKGLHKIKIEYFEYKGSQEISAGLVTKDGNKNPFTPFQLKK